MLNTISSNVSDEDQCNLMIDLQLMECRDVNVGVTMVDWTARSRDPSLIIFYLAGVYKHISPSRFLPLPLILEFLSVILPFSCLFLLGNIPGCCLCVTEACRNTQGIQHSRLLVT